MSSHFEAILTPALWMFVIWAGWIAANEVVRNAALDTHYTFPVHLEPLVKVWGVTNVFITCVLIFDMYKRVTRRSSEQFLRGDEG